MHAHAFCSGFFCIIPETADTQVPGARVTKKDIRKRKKMFPFLSEVSHLVEEAVLPGGVAATRWSRSCVLVYSIRLRRVGVGGKDVRHATGASGGSGVKRDGCRGRVFRFRSVYEGRRGDCLRRSCVIL